MAKWTLDTVGELFDLPFQDLILKAQAVLRENFSPNEVQLSQLLNIKTGGCPENCSYCPQSAHYQTGLEKEALMDLDAVVEAAREAKARGATRFCLGAAWRGPRDDDLERVCEMIEEVKKLGLESCVTLGLLKEHQAKRLKASGLDFYNHNIDSSKEYYEELITTRTYESRFETLQHVADAGINVCCGGILGMGESRHDRATMLCTLANMPTPPRSVPLGKLIRIPGTPLENAPEIDSLEFVRTVAVARILLPRSYIRIAAGRGEMSQDYQALCFLAGVNSVFVGDKLLTAENQAPEEDEAFFTKMGLRGEHASPCAKAA